MFRTILATIGLVAFANVAQAEVVTLKAKHYFDSTKKETVLDFGTKACGIKAIAFAVAGEQVSYVQYSEIIASYKTDSQWGVLHDDFVSAGLVLAGDQSRWYPLTGKADCLRKVYIKGLLNLWPASQMTISILGEK